MPGPVERCAVGLRIRCHDGLDVPELPAGAPSTFPVLDLRAAGDEAPGDVEDWTPYGELETADGTFWLEHAPSGRHRGRTDGGMQLTVDRGTSTVTVTAGGDEDRMPWQAWFTGQLLPLVATLRGLEPLHAGAVLIDGRCIAVTGPSSAGKSTLLAHLVALGAELFADDVIAVDPATLEAWPAGASLRLHEPVAQSAVRASRGRLRDLGATSGEKRLLSAPIAGARSARLAAVIFLEHQSQAPAAELDVVGEALGPLTLGMTYVPAWQEPARMIRLLELAAIIATIPTARLVTTRASTPLETAEVVLRGLREGLLREPPSAER